ncbi:MAG: hypothetical protein GY757_19950, partial [bacterium]|nr:hypothetical protein [bacterium]
AREKRYELRRGISLSGKASLSLSLNIPGYPKSGDLTTSFFDTVLIDLKRYLAAHRVFIDTDAAVRQTDEAGDFFIVPLKETAPPLEEIKKICETFEESYPTPFMGTNWAATPEPFSIEPFSIKLFPIGRIIDVDITGEELKAISSNKAKKCFICRDRAALECMRGKTHTNEEIRQRIFNGMQHYLEKRRCYEVSRRLSALATKAILYEVSLTPKPGTVDRYDSGSHRDMDFFTFVNSSAVISTGFYGLAAKGFEFDGPAEEILPLIRISGIRMEEEMFRETGGVNTQKGIIFLMGISLFAAANTIRKKGFLDNGLFVETVRDINRNLTGNELAKTIKTESKTATGQSFANKEDYKEDSKEGNKEDSNGKKGGKKGTGRNLTHGEECFRKYGPVLGAGIRDEVEKGLPTVMNHGLPELKKRLNGRIELCLEKNIADAGLATLMAIMAVNNDSNILYRKGPQRLEQLKALSKDVLNAKTRKERENYYSRLTGYCLKENISPGGSADLTAITFFIFFTEIEFIKKSE